MSDKHDAVMNELLADAQSVGVVAPVVTEEIPKEPYRHRDQATEESWGRVADDAPQIQPFSVPVPLVLGVLVALAGAGWALLHHR